MDMNENLTPTELIEAAAYMELDRQDDEGLLTQLGNIGDGYVTVKGVIHLPSLVKAILDAAKQ